MSTTPRNALYSVPGGWAYESKVLRPTNYLQLGGGIRSIRIPSCWPLYTLLTISVKFVPCIRDIYPTSGILREIK
ncbi:hypothetical protein YC2023_013213 [Brassica napus]